MFVVFILLNNVLCCFSKTCAFLIFLLSSFDLQCLRFKMPLTKLDAIRHVLRLVLLDLIQCWIELSGSKMLAGDFLGPIQSAEQL